METIHITSRLVKSIAEFSGLALVSNVASILTKSESVSSVLLKTVSTVSTIYIEEQ